MHPDESSPPRGASPAGILQSWKEIAAYFNVSIRTVQNWEEEHGLPVQRMPGPRGRVWARVEELETWRNRCEDSGEISFVEVQAAPPSPSRRWVWIGAGLILVLSILAFSRFRTPAQQFAGFRLEGDTLVGLDKRGASLWTHTFPVRVQTMEYLKSVFPALAPLLADLDNDGKSELVFPLHEASGTNTDELICFDHRGNVRWKFKPSFHFRNARGDLYAGPWKLRAVRELPTSFGSDILAAVSHMSMFPGAIVRLNRDGELLQTYLHSGHISDLMLITDGPSGKPVLYAIAAANSWSMVDLIALDPDRLQGASQEPPSDLEHTILGWQPARERARVLIPPTAISLVDSLYNTCMPLSREGDWVVANIVETISPSRGAMNAGPNYFQVFNYRLEHQSFRASDSLEVALRDFQAQGLLKNIELEAELRRVSREIRTLVPWN